MNVCLKQPHSSLPPQLSVSKVTDISQSLNIPSLPCFVSTASKLAALKPRFGSFGGGVKTGSGGRSDGGRPAAPGRGGKFGYPVVLSGRNGIVASCCVSGLHPYLCISYIISDSIGAKSGTWSSGSSSSGYTDRGAGRGGRGEQIMKSTQLINYHILLEEPLYHFLPFVH